MGRFSVVNFIEEKSVGVVPSIWVKEGICLWPNYKSEHRVHKSIISCEIPQKDWQRIEVRVMYSNDSFAKADKKAKVALDVSDIQSTSSEAENKKRKRKKKKYPPSSSDDDDDDDDNDDVNLPSFACSSNTNSDSVGLLAYPSHSQLDDSANVTEKRQSQNVEALSIVEEFNSFEPTNICLGESQEKDHIFRRRIYKMMEAMSRDIKDIKRMIFSSNAVAANPELPEECPELPLKEVEHAVDFENFLQQERNFDLVRNVFITVGGFNVKDCTKRLLQKIISNELSTKYNWKGSRGDKLPFSSLVNICKLISGAVRCHKDFTLATDTEITSVIKNWLNHARDRDGSRKKNL